MSGTINKVLPTMSEVIRAKLNPHLVALAAIFRQEMKDMRLADENREEVILRLQQSIINNNARIIEAMELFVEIQDDVSQILELAAELEAKVDTYEPRLSSIENRLNTIERN